MSSRILTALPVYNEVNHVEPVMAEVLKFADDVVLVNDGSTDGTAELLARRDDVRVLTHEFNRGYGAALVSAFEYAIAEGFETLVTIDCDGQHQPQLIPDLASRIAADPGVDMVSGSRYLKQFEGQSLPPEERRAINMQITQWINENLGLDLTDSFCGFKAYRVDSLPQLNITDTGYAMPLQLWVQAVAAGWKIVEHAVPLVYLEEERSFGGSLDDGKERMAYYMQVLEEATARCIVR